MCSAKEAASAPLIMCVISSSITRRLSSRSVVPACWDTSRRRPSETALCGWGLDQSSLKLSLTELWRHPVLLTSDHHGLLTFPMLVHGNALFCMSDLLEDHAIFRFSLAGAMVPLDNVTVRRAGLHITDNRDGKTRSIALFSQSLASHAVYAAPSFGMLEIGRRSKRCVNSSEPAP